MIPEIYLETKQGILKRWNEIEVTRQFTSIDHSFSLKIPISDDDVENLFSSYKKTQRLELIESSCTIYCAVPIAIKDSTTLTKQKLFTGIIKKAEIEIDATMCKLSISGVNTCHVLTVSSSDSEIKSWEQVTLQTIVQDILVKQFPEITYVFNEVPTKLHTISYNEDETIYEFLLKLAKYENLMLYENVDGVLIFDHMTQEMSVDLLNNTEVMSVTNASYTIDSSDLFRTYALKGERSNYVEDFSSWEKSTKTQYYIEVKDRNVKQNSRIVLTEDTATDEYTSLKRLEWEAKLRSDRTLTITTTTNTWVDINGKLWVEGMVVRLMFDRKRKKWIPFPQIFRIESINYTLNQTKYSAKITLKLFDTFIDKPLQQEVPEIAQENRQLWSSWKQETLDDKILYDEDGNEVNLKDYK
jgi:prophage tail gpP-like protein